MIVKGILKSFDAGTYTASVQLIGSFITYIEGVAVSRAIPAVEMVADRTCAVLFFDETNFADGMVISIIA